MPKLARTFIKTGFAYFLTAMILGIGLKIEPLNLPVLTPLFWHALMVGWITQIIFGVSFWMFPGRPQQEGIKTHFLGWLTYFLLNSGLALRLTGEPMLSYSASSAWQVIVAGSAVLQIAGGLAYVIEMWPRIQSKKQRIHG